MPGEPTIEILHRFDIREIHFAYHLKPISVGCVKIAGVVLICAATRLCGMCVSD